MEMGKSRFFWKLRVHRQKLGKCDQGDNKVDQNGNAKWLARRKKQALKQLKLLFFKVFKRVRM